MEKIILASNNKHKIKEFRKMLDAEVLCLEDIGFYDDIVEDGETFKDNALIKAKAVSKFLKEKGIVANVVAEDSGLCVNALGGAPGVYSARYAGEHDDNANRQKLLKSLEGKTDRSAYFICVIVKLFTDGHYIAVEGKTFGQITTEELGDKSFGYDCLFYSDELHKTFGQVSSEEKNAVSHRGRALENLLKADKISF